MRRGEPFDKFGANGLRQELLDCDTTSSLKKQYSQWKVVQCVDKT